MAIIVDLPTQNRCPPLRTPMLSLSKCCVTCKPAPLSPIIENYVKCFPFGRAKPAQANAFQPPGKLSFRRPVHRSSALIHNSVLKGPCSCSPYPVTNRGSKIQGEIHRICTSAPRTAVFQLAQKMLGPSLCPGPPCHRTSIFAPPSIQLSFQLLEYVFFEGKLPKLAHVPPAHSRLPLHGRVRPLRYSRLYASATAHSSMPVYRELSILVWLRHTVIQLIFHRFPIP